MRALEALRRELGADGLSEEPVQLAEGLRAEASFRPANAEELSQALKALGAAGARVLLRCGGRRMGFGNLPPSAADLVVELGAFAGIDEFDADDGVLHAGAATPLSEIARVAEEGGWELPFEAPDPGASLGGMLATASSGPRLPGFGPARDNVLGLEVALASGERTRCGGRVVKNVTGYDLAKLYIGSLGTLGVFEAAWLRLRARPAAKRTLALQWGDAAERSDELLELARLETVRSASLLDAGAARAMGAGAPGSGALLWLEFAGEGPAVEGDAERALAAAPAAEDPGALSALGAWMGDASEPGAVPSAGTPTDMQEGSRPGAPSAPRADGIARARFSCAPSSLPALWGGLASIAGERVALPSLARVLARVPLGVAPAERIGELRALAKRCRATLFFESLPAAAKAGIDVYDAPPAEVSVMRALKQRFDPNGLLNPGRFAGGL